MVYVDPLKNYGAGEEAPRCFRNVKSCHMYSDNLEELHKKAKQIGLQRSWFQDKNSLPHYDLVASKRAIAVSFGVIEHSFEEMVKFVQEWRKKRASNP